MPETINSLAKSAAKDEQAREQLIAAQERTILKMASCTVHRYISKSDDEWAVALSAFSRAVDTFDESRGDFLPYAGLLIQRRLTDYYRIQRKISDSVISLDEPITDGDGNERLIDVPDPCSDELNKTLKDEILAVNETLIEYGFRFFDLTECSPQQDRTRKQCAEVIRAALEEPIIVNHLKARRKLPVRELSQKSGVSKKILDRYRKYIIMAILILSDDYPQLSVYLNFVRKEETL